MSESSNEEPESDDFFFQLFVAGDESNSREAGDNLNKICESYLEGHCKIQTVDVFKSYDIALENGIFLTPALVKVSPPPKLTIFGNLSDTKSVLKTLGIGVEV